MRVVVDLSVCVFVYAQLSHQLRNAKRPSEQQVICSQSITRKSLFWPLELARDEVRAPSFGCFTSKSRRANCEHTQRTSSIE